ncbi:dUTP diphosphatase, partial [Stenotrophomonas maltophilia group sp. RNC7]|uniref:dUTP diphosphatase n=1 Tax=Stenotrophomonas maltophilia group sp. RNC7 TaxID=3071467 RepID=UPI0027E14421
MNLGELFEMQRKLDEHIVREKGLDGQDLLPKKILALQVELGELSNEWRGFKFWSNNQNPNTEEFYEIREPCKCAENYDPICTDCMNTREIIHPAVKNPLL